MKEETLESWEQFEEVSARMIADTKRLQKERTAPVDYPLFRGVHDSKYPLRSSLERVREAMGLYPYMSLAEYYHAIKTVRKHIETVTGKKWDLDTEVLPEVPPRSHSDILAYEFMAYLRHNGFPSPLLDWTQSPYVAAFFAFRDIYHKPVDDKCVSIFALREDCGNGKAWILQRPNLCTIGHSIATFRTHYLQQSEYSICVQEEEDRLLHFGNHEDVKNEEDEYEQDVLIRYNIPMSEREKVLRKLDLMNITAYSLFHSEPSLMDTLAIRELVLER
jgi:hypothetical protein